MRKWNIELDGSTVDIAAISNMAQYFKCTVTDNQMSGTVFENAQNASEARSLATQLLARLNGVARTAHLDHEPVRVGTLITEIDQNGVRHISVESEGGEFRLRGSAVRLALKKADGTTQVDAETIRDAARVERLANDSELSAILEAIGGELSWRTLRIAFEKLAAIVGGGGNAFVKQGYATSEELAQFKSNIEHPGHSGLDAVHGVPKGPIKGSKMSEREGLSLLTRLLNSHLDNAGMSSA